MISEELFLKEIQRLYNQDEELSMDTNVYTDMRIDSMQFIFFISEIEEKYNLNVDLDRFKGLNTLRDFYESIGEKK